MNPTRIRACAAAALFWLCQCGPGERLAGGSEIGNPTGVIVDEQGRGVQGAVLRLLPRNFDPVRDRVALDSLRTLTGTGGTFAFAGVPRGEYNLVGTDPATGLRILAGHVVDGNADLGPDTLRRPGKVVAEIPDAFGAGGYVYIPGTPFFAGVDVVGRAVLDSVPAGTIALRFAARDSTQVGPRFQPFALAPGAEAKALREGVFAGFRALRLAPGEDIQAAADSLRPGDTLYLRAGIHYLGHLTLALKGLPDAWISLRNAPGEQPVLRGTDPGRNLVEFLGAEYVDVSGLEVDSTMPGTDAFRFSEGAVSHHVSLRNLRIHRIRGIAVNGRGNHHHVAVQGNHIHDLNTWPGTAVHLGDVKGQWSPENWNIEGNWIHHCGFGGAEGYGVSIQRGARRITIRGNAVHDVSTAGLRVSGALVDADPADSSLVEGNAIWSCGIGLEAIGDAVIRNNVVFASPLLLLSQQNPDTVPPFIRPRNLRIYQNTFHGDGEILLRHWDSSRACVFANNAAYASKGLTLEGTGALYGNVSDFPHAGFSPGTASADLRDPANRSFYPARSSALVDKAGLPITAHLDFTGRFRDTRPDVGAYEYAGENAPPPIREGFLWPRITSFGAWPNRP